MAGTMRRMGIYLGLVEDDDARAYGRYDARQPEHPDDRRHGRHDDARDAPGYAHGGYRTEEGRVGEEGRSRWWPNH